MFLSFSGLLLGVLAWTLLFLTACCWFYYVYQFYACVRIKMRDGQRYKLAYFSYHKRYSAYDLAEAIQLAKTENGKRQDNEKNLQLSESERASHLKDLLEKTQIEKTQEIEEILQNHLEHPETAEDNKGSN